MRRKALVVGIDDYPNAQLEGCVNDSRDVANMLSTNGDGSHNFDVIHEVNICDKSKLCTKLKELFDGSPDVALFYFAGHGHKEGKIVTPDYKQNDEGILLSQILNMANKSAARNKVIILDSCYSGQLGEGIMTSSEVSVLENGITIMTASSRNELAGENNGHGVFTELLLQALRGSAADVMGKITPAGIYSFIDQSLGAWQQRPIFKTNVSELIALRTVKPRISIESLRRLSQYFNNQDDRFSLDPSFEDTNDPQVVHKVIEPYANVDNVTKFKELQAYQSVGLVEPVDADFMYFAAMNSKSCQLTALGKHYWRLSRDKRF